MIKISLNIWKKNYPYQDIQYRMYYAPYRIYIYYNLKGIYEIERRKKWKNSL